MTWLPVIVLACAGLIYAGHIAFFTCGWHRIRKRNSSESITIPDVSILLPVRNEEGVIEKVLFSLSKQVFLTPGSEVLVIDDGSIDRTAELAEKAIKELGPDRFRLIRLMPAVGKKKAIGSGVSHARREIIVTTDADCQHPPGWFATMSGNFMDPSTMMVAGPVKSAPGKGLFGGFQELEFLGLVTSGAGAAGLGHPIYCNGANLAYRKAAFLEVGGFAGNEQYASGDDVFLLHKIKRHFGGRTIKFDGSPSGWVTTEAPGNLRCFLEQRARWASKSKGYEDAMALSTTLSVLVFNIMMVIMAGLAISGWKNAGLAVLCAWILKMAVDFPILYMGAVNTGRRKLLAAYPLFQLAYPFYVLAVAVRVGFGGFRWKEGR